MNETANDMFFMIIGIFLGWGMGGLPLKLVVLGVSGFVVMQYIIAYLIVIYKENKNGKK